MRHFLFAYTCNQACLFMMRQLILFFVLLPAYGVSLSPAVAGGLMAFSSVTVVVNSLLLKAQRLKTV